jgi:hypothetical protein
MLDRTNYTTRTDLTPQEIQALVNVRTKLETGEIGDFSMGVCTSCIGGYMAQELRKVRHEFVRNNRTSKFGGLFYPYLDHDSLSRLSRAGAIQAITNFLGGSDTPWQGLS